MYLLKCRQIYYQIASSGYPGPFFLIVCRFYSELMLFLCIAKTEEVSSFESEEQYSVPECSLLPLNRAATG